MARARRLGVSGALLLLGAGFAACDINPQPLPPENDKGSPAAAPQDPGFGGSENSPPSPTNREGGSEAGPGTGDADADSPADASPDASDASDAG